jgi:hypothetical protein
MDKRKFDEIIEDYGIEQAMRSRRASLVRSYEQEKGFRWYGLQWERDIESHDFNAKWCADHGYCHLYGHTYYADGRSEAGYHYA